MAFFGENAERLDGASRKVKKYSRCPVVQKRLRNGCATAIIYEDITKGLSS